jgi:hypothetical protein
MTTRTMKLDTIEVAIDDLLLDPNNPRFVQDLRLKDEVPDGKVESLQTTLLRRFVMTEDDEDPDGDRTDSQFFSIKDLTDSMSRIGFVPIDRVVVRRLKDSPKFLVIEGNRRVSAAKRLLENDSKKAATAPELSEAVRASLSRIEALILDTKGLSEEEIHNDIGVVLGLRHYGQVLGWDPLPRAVNIFKEYMGDIERGDRFKLDSVRITDVAARLSIPRGEVKKALRTYIAYKQLTSSFTPPPRPSHYSMIAELVSNSKLTTHYFEQDPSTFELSSDSLERLYAIGQFDSRDAISEPILARPQDTKPFAKIVGEAFGGQDEPTKNFAKSLLAEVEKGERSLEDASNNLTSFMASRRWIDSLWALLTKQEESLPVNGFSTVGMDVHNLEDVNKAFKYIRKVLDV